MLLKDGVKNGKHVLIAEGLENAGEDLVETFAGRGATVAFLYHAKAHQSLELVRRSGALNIKCNLRNEESLNLSTDVVKEFFQSQLDVFVCNVCFESEGSGYCGAAASEEDDSSTKQEINNVWSQARAILQMNENKISAIIERILPMMNRGASIILLMPSEIQLSTTIANKECARMALQVLQHSLEGLIEAASDMLKEKDIRINGIYADNPDASGKDIASVAQFLASGSAASLTGQIIQL